MVKKFADFGISDNINGFTGPKVGMSHVLNREIMVHAFKIESSKHPDKSANGKCLHMQISIGDNMHVLFSGSGILAQDIQKVPEDGFPFTTTIIKEKEWFRFT